MLVPRRLYSSGNHAQIGLIHLDIVKFPLGISKPQKEILFKPRVTDSKERPYTLWMVRAKALRMGNCHRSSIKLKLRERLAWIHPCHHEATIKEFFMSRVKDAENEMVIGCL